MIQAPVGWQCPECVKAGSRQSPFIRYRPAPAGTVGARLSWRSAPVTVGLVVVNVIAFLVSRAGNVSVLAQWGLVPACVQGGQTVVPACIQPQGGQVYRLFTAPFLHVSVTHIALNMLSLVIVGIPVENAIGRVRYLVLYLAAALGGSVLTYLIAVPNQIGVGASGAIFGVFGAYFVIARRRRLRTGGIAAMIAINLVYGFIAPNIGWQAHVGGLVVGVAVALGFALAEHRPRLQARGIELATCAVVAVVLFGLMQFSARPLSG